MKTLVGREWKYGSIETVVLVNGVQFVVRVRNHLTKYVRKYRFDSEDELFKFLRERELYFLEWQVKCFKAGQKVAS